MTNKRLTDDVSSSSDDENLFFMDRRPQLVRKRQDYLEEFDDDEFKVRFRLSKETYWIV